MKNNFRVIATWAVFHSLACALASPRSVPPSGRRRPRLSASAVGDASFALCRPPLLFAFVPSALRWLATHALFNGGPRPRLPRLATLAQRRAPAPNPRPPWRGERATTRAGHFSPRGARRSTAQARTAVPRGREFRRRPRGMAARHNGSRRLASRASRPHGRLQSPRNAQRSEPWRGRDHGLGGGAGEPPEQAEPRRP